MKKINKNLKPFLASMFVLIAVILVSIPSIGLAKDNEKEEKNNRFNYSWSRFNEKEEKNNRFNYSWRRFFDSFEYRANEAVKTKVNNLTPIISGITAPTVLEVGETGTWTVRAKDPQNKSLSYDVDWGDDNDSKSLSRMMETAFVQTSTFTHAYDEEGEYKIKFTVSNEDGLKTTSTVTVHIENEDDDDSLDGPIISNLTVKSLKPSQATINWITDTRANSSVWYGITSPTDTSKSPMIFHPAKIWNHKINLSKLEPNTKYYVVVESSNNDGTTKSSEVSFTTPALPNNVTPVITKLEGTSMILAGENATITIKAYDPKNGTLTYSADWGDDIEAMTALKVTSKPFVQDATLSHVYDKIGTYTATFTVQNEAGYKTSSSMKIRVVDINNQ